MTTPLNEKRFERWFAAHRRRSEQSPAKEWLAVRRDAGLKVDPKNAEIDYCYGPIGDPYEIGPKMLGELHQVGRVYFARSPGSKVWVAFDDLPEYNSTCSLEKEIRNL